MQREALSELPKRRAAQQVGQTLLVALAVCLVVLALTLVFGRSGERIAVQLCVFITAVVALGIFTGNSGIVSFGHGAFMALGAYTAGILTLPALMQRTALPQLPAFLGPWELSPWMALGPALGVGLLVALGSGFAISRLRDASATISTLGFLIIIHSVLVGARDITRGSQTFYGVPRVMTLEVALVAAIAFIVLARLYRESRWGLMIRAVRDDEAAAVGVGINPQRMRLLAWTLSGGLAALAGALYGFMLGAFSPSTFYFALTFSIVAMLIIGGRATVSGAVCGVVVVTLLQDGVRQLEGGITLAGIELPAVFGLTTVVLGLAILIVIWRRPEGIIGYREATLPGLERIFAPLFSATPTDIAAATSARSALTVEGVSKNFAGIKAVDGARFEAPPGQVTGLIGPNGAGKTTMVNLLTAQIRADSGAMHFGAADLIGLPPHRVAHEGLGRTFQNIRLFDNLTVYENVLVAALAMGHSRGHARAIALREIGALDLTAEAMMLARNLPYGARKRLEIARCLALEPKMILLDEPAAGMNPDETGDLAGRLRRLCEERHIGLILIDHDLEFVKSLSSSIVVMNRGAVIAHGTPGEVAADPAVVEAYIGRGRSRGPTEQPEGRVA